MKIISIVGTRPQFLKLIPLSLEFNNHSNIQHIIIHSGQHYDDNMFTDIFKCLNSQLPNYILKRTGNTLIQNLSNMMVNIEEIVIKEEPDIIIVFGDCDTTTAGALVANKNNIFLVHIEAGMRSYNKKMPEEINRLITDNISDLLLCSTKDSLINLKNENNKTDAYFVGNLQLDLLSLTCEKYNNINILLKHNTSENNFILLTIHRAYNTNKKTLNYIFNQLKTINKKIIFPTHPRTLNIINTNNIIIPQNIIIIPPVNYLDMTILERFCLYIITDSGGIQAEAGFLKKKCIVMRTETEWKQEIINNNNILYDFKTPLKLFINKFLKIPIKKTNYYNKQSHKEITNLILKI